MEEVTGTKERNQKNDIAVRNNGDQASCKTTVDDHQTVIALISTTFLIIPILNIYIFIWC